MLMTLMSSLHNLSRSVGYALLAAGGATMVLAFVGGEMVLYLVWKGVRGDLMVFIPVEGPFGVVLSLLYRVVVKIVVDFSGCLQFR